MAGFIRKNTQTNLYLVNQLLCGWSGKLTTLEFNGIRFDPVESQFDSEFGVTVRQMQLIDGNSKRPKANYTQEMCSMVGVINQQCLALQNLSFYCEESLSLKQSEIDLSCLGRLKTLRFCSDDHFDRLFSSLQHYAVYNDQLAQIHIDNLMFDSQYLEKFPDDFVRYQTLIGKFTLLSGIRPTSGLHLSKFANLTRLTLELNDFLQMTAQLVTLTNLVQIVLKIFDAMRQYPDTPSNTFHRLPSVKMVSFVGSPVGTDLRSNHWAWILPSIELVEFRQNGRHIRSASDAIVEMKWIERAKQILQPIIEQCSTLKRANVIAYYFVGHMVQLRIKKEFVIEQL